MPTSVRSLLSLGIPLLILLCIAVLGALTFASIRQNALENGMSITKLTADSRHEMFLRYLKRQKLQATNFIERTRRFCSLIEIGKRKCLQTALDGYVATIGAESARLDVPGMKAITSGEARDIVEHTPGSDETVEFKLNKQGNPYFVIEAVTKDGGHMLTLHVRLNIIHEIFENPEQLGTYGETFLVTNSGLFISPPKHLRTLMRQEEKVEDPMIAQCQSGKSLNVSELRMYGREVLASFRHVKEIGGGCIIAMLLKEQALSPMNKLKWEWITLIIVFALLSSLAGYLITRKITRPILELSKIAKALQAGNFNIDERSSGGAKEIRLFEDTFKQMARSIQTQIKNQEELMSIVSHDLRNPVAATRISAQMGIRNLEKAEVENQKEGLRKLFQRIEDQTGQMSRLIDELMDVARAQSGIFKVNLKRTKISQFTPFIESMRPLSDAKGIKLDIEFANEDGEVLADFDRISQVFSNLLGNALKFTGEGGTISVGQKEENGSVLFWVQDTGIGIPKEQLPHIFDKNWQASDEQKKGMGLGLFITKKIIDDHGGKIWVESSSHTGTCFYFTLRHA